MHIPGEVKFLVCVDSSDECKAALRFACMRAKNSKGEVAILYVIEPNDMQHFAGVEKVMEREAEEEANRVLADLKKETFNEFSIEIETIISYGVKYNKIVDLINEDKTISILVLGAAPEGKGTNDLINKFSTELTSSIHIPLTIVPGNLSKIEIEKIT
ncbi:MAG: universal stress protein [Alphaproteobacteria bacterium]|mgnify:FL=1|tara:strand:+ start:1024 stop:1497 length:474 start_codon:yes stop_codon:yes gene_type:complete